MKTAVFVRLLTVGLVGLGSVQSCSSKDEAATEEPVAPDTEENAAAEGEANAAEGEANAADAEAGGEENADAAAASEGGTEATDGSVDADAAAIAEAMGGGSTVSNVDTGEMPAEASSEAPNAGVEMAPEASSASVDTAAAQPMSGGNVKYVKNAGVKVHSGPDAGSAVVRQLSKGDHMLVTVEGGWARLADGGFVAMQGLSDKGVGRPRSAGAWR